jgi:hypothetical protein
MHRQTAKISRDICSDTGLALRDLGFGILGSGDGAGTEWNVLPIDGAIRHGDCGARRLKPFIYDIMYTVNEGEACWQDFRRRRWPGTVLISDDRVPAVISVACLFDPASDGTAPSILGAISDYMPASQRSPVLCFSARLTADGQCEFENGIMQVSVYRCWWGGIVELIVSCSCHRQRIVLEGCIASDS